jgi:TonB family protein
MKRWPLALLLVFLAANSLQAEDKAHEEANMILVKASDLETFKVGEIPKFRLEVHFSFFRPRTTEIKGVFTREADSPFLWHEELEFGDYRFHKVRIRKQIWTRENSDFIPMPVQELWGALYFTNFSLSDNDVVKRVHDMKINSIQGRCIEFETVVGNDKKEKQICVQKDSGYLISWEDGTKEISYSDFEPLGERVRPRRIAIDFQGMEKMVADINYQEVEKFDPVDFEAIIGGEVTDICSASRNPIAKFVPDPVYPLTVRRGAYKGKIIVDVKVGPDGSVLAAAVLQSLQPDLDAAVLDAAKKWKFEPGTCDGNSVKSFTQMTVTYH